jgi:hypothetical protein
MGRHSVWELVFFMVILKIPIVYLGLVVWHAIKAEPTPEEGAAVTVRLGSDDPGPGRRRRPRPRPFVPRPHGGPSRRPSRTPRPAVVATRTNRDAKQ